MSPSSYVAATDPRNRNGPFSISQRIISGDDQYQKPHNQVVTISDDTLGGNLQSMFSSKRRFLKYPKHGSKVLTASDTLEDDRIGRAEHVIQKSENTISTVKAKILARTHGKEFFMSNKTNEQETNVLSEKTLTQKRQLSPNANNRNSFSQRTMEDPRYSAVSIEIMDKMAEG